eukprot:54228_1
MTSRRNWSNEAGYHWYCAAVDTMPYETSFFQIGTLIASILGLIISSLITYHSILEIPNLKLLDWVIKYLYMSYIIISYIIFILAFIQSLLCIITNEYDIVLILNALFLILSLTLYLLLLAILIFRLYTTFMDSYYKLSKLSQWILFILYIIISIFAVFNVIEEIIWSAHLYTNKNVDSFHHVIDWFDICAILFYILTSIYCIYLFASKLMELTSQIATAHILNEKQKALIQKTHKYVSIFSLALITTFFTLILWVLYSIAYRVSKLEVLSLKMVIFAHVIDYIINIICLYLQFSFAAKYYDKYCKCIQHCCCWKKVFIINVRKSSSKRFKELETSEREDIADETDLDSENTKLFMSIRTETTVASTP